MKVNFGFANSAFENTQHKTDGAEFRISAALEDNQEKILWHRFVDPISLPQEQDELEAVINLDNENIKEIIFETLPGYQNDFMQDYTYWSGIYFDN